MDLYKNYKALSSVVLSNAANASFLENMIHSGGGTHISRHMVMRCSNGLLFHNKSLTRVPFLQKIFLNMGSFFKNFCLFTMPTHKKFEKWAYISRKIPKSGYLFCQNGPLNWVWVSRLEWHTLVRTKFEYPYPGIHPCFVTSYPTYFSCSEMHYVNH